MMEIFSSVCAILDRDFTIWLPPREELHNFLKHLSGVEIFLSEKDGQLCISGTLEAIVSIKNSLSSFILDTRQEEIRTEINAETPYVNEQNYFSNNIIQQLEEQSSENNKVSSVDEDEVNEYCLNIEVLQSKSKEELKSKDFKFSCSLCSFKSQRESHYQKHMKLHQTTSTIFHCDKCNFSTLRFTHLRHHQIIHSSKQIMCPTGTCNYSTDNAKLLSKHQRLKHKIVSLSTDQVVRSCPVCSYKTTRLYLYERHMKIHSAGESKGGPNIFICSQCDYRTTRKIHYVRHVRDVHRQWRPYLCDLCGKAFKRPDALKQHNILHSTPEKDGSFPFQCLVKNCLKKCHSRAHLKEHQTVHSSERSFLCEICGASFKTRSIQRKHIANLHQNPRAFLCHFCNKRFNTNYALRRHMKQHPSTTNTDEIDQSAKLITIVLPVTGQAITEETVITTEKSDEISDRDLLTEEPEYSSVE